MKLKELLESRNTTIDAPDWIVEDGIQHTQVVLNDKVYKVFIERGEYKYSRSLVPNDCVRRSLFSEDKIDVIG